MEVTLSSLPERLERLFKFPQITMQARSCQTIRRFLSALAVAKDNIKVSVICGNSIFSGPGDHLPMDLAGQYPYLCGSICFVDEDA
jgi:hypothetical protein